MHDHPDAPGSLRPEEGEHGAGHDVALQNVRAVMSWYRQDIHRERQAARTAGPRLEELTAALRECVADQRAVEQAGHEQAGRIAALYQARYAALPQE
ncbi:hypothetical protein [Streptomyces sp. NPDC056987]|uniref:hypothetical protein n=1 Tax=Streptomyces sp. NPDC056987 TaxID=3345988 RepID=UPI00363E852F